MASSETTADRDRPNYDVEIDAADLREDLAEMAAEKARKVTKHRRDHREYTQPWDRPLGELSQYQLWELEALGARRAYADTLAMVQPENSMLVQDSLVADDGTVEVRAFMREISRRGERAHEDSYGPHTETRQASAAETAYAKVNSLLRDDYGVGWPRLDELGGNPLEEDLP